MEHPKKSPQTVPQDPSRGPFQATKGNTSVRPSTAVAKGPVQPVKKTSGSDGHSMSNTDTDAGQRTVGGSSGSVPVSKAVD